MGVAVDHVPTVAMLGPGLVTVSDEGASDHYFVSSGIASVTEDSVLTVSAVECVPVADLDPAAVTKGIEEVCCICLIVHPVSIRQVWTRTC